MPLLSVHTMQSPQKHIAEAGQRDFDHCISQFQPVLKSIVIVFTNNNKNALCVHRTEEFVKYVTVHHFILASQYFMGFDIR